MANVIVDARGLGGAAGTNQTSESRLYSPVLASEARSWSGSAAYGWTDSSGRAWARANVGDLGTHAWGVAEAEITGLSGSLASFGRGAAAASWEDRFTVDADPSLAGQLGELTATLVLDGLLAHTSSRFDSALYFRVSCRLTDSLGGGGGNTNFHGGTKLTVNNEGFVVALPLDGMLIGLGVVYQVPLRFHFGGPVSVAVSCQVDADNRELTSVAGGGRKTGESLGDVALLWGGISEVRVVGGNVVTNFTTTSDSGFDYRLGATINPPVITRVQALSQGLALEWTDLGPRSYIVETTRTLPAASWMPVQGVTWPLHTNQAVLPLPGQSPAFFRVRVR